MGDMVDRVAKVMAESCFSASWEDIAEHYREGFLADASAIIEVMKEPTREMWAAGGNAAVGKTSVHHDVAVEAIWRAMIDAAL